MTIHRTWHTLINIASIWNFNSLFRVCLIFYTYDSANFKSIGNNNDENATRYCAGSRYYSVMCSTDVYCSAKPAAVAPKETITHHFFRFWIGQKKTVDAAKICGGAENVVVQTQQNIRKWIARFYYFRHLYSAGSVCIAHNNCMSCPSIWATLSALLINILLEFFQLFLHSDQPLCGWNNPVQRCLPVRRLTIQHAGGGGAVYRTDWQTALMCNRRRPAATSSRRASFSALASANSFVYFASSAATSALTHLHGQ